MVDYPPLRQVGSQRSVCPLRCCPTRRAIPPALEAHRHPYHLRSLTLWVVCEGVQSGVDGAVLWSWNFLVGRRVESRDARKEVNGLALNMAFTSGSSLEPQIPYTIDTTLKDWRF